MKILGSDFDGTLTQNGITDAKIAAIEKWRKAGHKFGIVSGRGGNFQKWLCEEFPKLKVDFFAACNGGYITDCSGNVFFDARCNSVSAVKLAADLLSLGSELVHVNGAEYVCVLKSFEDRPTWVLEEDVCLLENFKGAAYFNQVSAQMPFAEDSPAVVEKINNKYSKWVVALQNGRCIDIVPLGVNKASGMYQVMKFFGGSYDDVITVGDNINDIDMIKEFRSYAMENGVDAVKELAYATVSDITELLEKEI